MPTEQGVVASLCKKKLNVYRRLPGHVCWTGYRSVSVYEHGAYIHTSLNIYIEPDIGASLCTEKFKLI
jgi:hypothetical protein